MKIFSLGTPARLFVLLIATTAFSLSATSQNGKTNQKDDVESFISSVARTIYNLAWPTATYRDVSLDDITPVEGGADVAIKLSGLSAFDNSDLWLRLVVVIRNGSINDIRVLSHNAILVAPFATTGAIAKALKETAEQYAAQQRAPVPAPPDSTAPPLREVPTPAPAPPPNLNAEGVCVINSTPSQVSFDYHWGNGEWKQATIEPDHAFEIWWALDPGETGSPQLSIRYDDDFAPGFSERDYNVSRTPTVLPLSCDKVANYKFTMSGDKILVYAVGQ